MLRMMCVYEREWIVSENAQVSIQVSSSGSDTSGRKATLGLRPWIESSSVWYFRLLMKMCFSCSGRPW